MKKTSAGGECLAFADRSDQVESHLSSSVFMALRAEALKLCLLSAIHTGAGFYKEKNVLEVRISFLFFKIS